VGEWGRKGKSSSVCTYAGRESKTEYLIHNVIILFMEGRNDKI
jgi:hypothetical protein